MAEEKIFENKIKRLIEENDGWHVKFFANGFTKSGIPDILACINGHFIGIEVKASHGKASELQIHHCKEIRKAGGLAYIVYPSGYEKLKTVIENLKHEIFNINDTIVLK